MTANRELVVLGTAAQSPTAARSQNSCVLRWHDELIVFDPGEGTQRQLLRAGVNVARITRVFITHFHGDHCLGLPGLVQRRRLVGADDPLHLHYGPWGRTNVEHLLGGSEIDFDLPIEHHLHEPGTTMRCGRFEVTARALDHTTRTVGWRLAEPEAVHLLPDRLARAGVEGAAAGTLKAQGRLTVDGRTIELDEVAETRPGRSFAFVMDTRRCDNAHRLADGVDMLVSEATFLDEEADRAHDYGHLTAGQAAGLAAAAGVGRLVVTHFSERYDDLELFRRQSEAVFPGTVVARDLDVVAVPPEADD